MEFVKSNVNLTLAFYWQYTLPICLNLLRITTGAIGTLSLILLVSSHYVVTLCRKKAYVYLYSLLFGATTVLIEEVCAWMLIKGWLSLVWKKIFWVNRWWLSTSKKDISFAFLLSGQFFAVSVTARILGENQIGI